MSNKDGKTEKPTPRRIKKARGEGQIARTPDAATWLAIAVAAALMPQAVQVLNEGTRELLAQLPDVAGDPTPARALHVLGQLPLSVLLAVGPPALGALVAALLATAAQGVHPTTAGLKPKWNRLSPKQGVKRMFGPRAAWEAVKAMLKVTAIGTVAFVVGKSLLPVLVGSGVTPLPELISQLHEGLRTLLWATAVTGLLLALADYAYARHELTKQLRMTPREIKDEMRQTEGDPMVKGAIRSKQMAMSRNRMLASVADADVVLVNPTHYAVALRYEPSRGAPRVVAKGVGALALKIRERARENRVPVVEDKPLARLLYRVCDVEDEVPTELYVAVARILAFVMSAGRPSARASSSRRPGSAQPLPELPARSALRARRARQRRGGRSGSAVS